jgi:tetratricopeptide (TPR) repeat protein
MFAFAQKPSLNKAYNFYYEKNWEQAKEMIDQCMQDPKLQEKAQTWLYKGNIYFYLANDEYAKKQQQSNYQIKYPNASSEAYIAFHKALSINKNIESIDMLNPEEALSKLYPFLFVAGVDLLIAADYNAAQKTLEQAISSYEMKIPPDYPLNGEIYYYYAYNEEMMNHPDKAISGYEKAIADKSNNPNVYVRLIELYKTKGLNTQIGKILDQAVVLLPDDPDLWVAQVDYYSSTDSVKAENLLKKLPSSVYQKTESLVNLANYYIKKNIFFKAEELLNSALQKSQNNYVILYNLGYCELKIYEQKTNERNAYVLKGDLQTAGQLRQEAMNYLEKSAELFEKALNLEPKDLNIMEQLREIYAKLQSPKFDEMDKQIKQIKQ